MTDPPNIHEHVASICNALGLTARDCARLEIEPSFVVATVYRKRNGAKYVDENTNTPAVERHRFKVTA